MKKHMFALLLVLCILTLVGFYVAIENVRLNEELRVSQNQAGHLAYQVEMLQSENDELYNDYITAKECLMKIDKAYRYSKNKLESVVEFETKWFKRNTWR